MKRTLHFVNGMTALILGLTSLSIVVTASFSLAATPTPKKTMLAVQPKIVSIKTEVAAPSFGTASDSMQWPADAGIINEVSSDSTGVWVTPAVQSNAAGQLRWAHVAKWTDDAPDPSKVFERIVATAQSDVTASSLNQTAKSPIFPINPATQAGKYLTIYSYTTNADAVSPSFFPQHIDYGTATTFFVPIPEPDTTDATDQADDSTSTTDGGVY